MNGSKNSFNREARGRFGWRWLALALCLTLLLGGMAALADEDNGLTVVAESDETLTFTITWNLDGEISTSTVNQNETPTPPTKSDTAQYHYTVTWPEIAPATADVTYTATVSQELRQYNITFVDEGGATLKETAAYDYGTSIDSIKPADPTKADDENNTYTFAGWTPSQSEVTGDQTFTASYSASPKAVKYTITFVDESGTALSSKEYDQGTAAASIEQPAAPEKAADSEYTYSFAGWEPSIADVTGDQTYKPTYNKTPIPKTYKITFVDEDGKTVLLAAAEYAEGTAADQIKKPADPTKAATDQYTYTFAGWSPAIANVTKDETYRATYTPALQKYTITWQNEDGVVLEKDDNVEYGATPSYNGAKPAKASDGNNLYNFKAWNPAPATVTGNATYTATYEAESLTKTSGAYTYKLNPEKTEATILGWNGSDAELIVPAQFENANVVAIGAGAFQNKSTLTKLEIPAGVKTIGDNAFADCANLASLTLPDSLEPLLGQNILLNDGALTSLVLRATLASTLNPADTITHNITANGVETAVSVQLPMAFTDIIVTKNNVQENAASLTVDCDFTVAEGHSVSVESGATLTNNATLTNFGTITNNGAFTNAGSVLSCGGTVTGSITGGTYRANGDHSFADGKCAVCGVELPELSVRYNGSAVKKTYDKTHNVKLSASDFAIEDTHGLDLKISGISASYDKVDAGKRTVKVTLKLSGNDAAMYGSKVATTVSATIEPKPLVITPTAGQKKTYGAADPTTYKGTVRGLLSGDKISGKLSRETGENAGRYRILQGTIDAGENYEVQVLEQYFVIEAKSINSSDVGLVTIGNQRYTGQEVKPAITLRFGKNVLKEDTDFKAAFTNNVQPGVASVKLTGMGNYTGERETSFRILNIASGVNSSSSGFSSYSYSGFDDGEYESMEDYDEDDDEEDEDLGKLILNGNDYGTILFDGNGMPSAFVQFEEPIESLDDDENAPEQYSLTIIADPLVDEETGETLLLDDGEREQYDELHLRLTVPLVDTLTSLGYTEIIYEVDSAELTIPLDSLVSEIPLEDEVETEVIGTIQPEEETVEGGEAVEKAIEELAVELAPTSLTVEAYDICVEQSEVALLTEREIGLLETYDQVTPTYRVLVRAVIESEDAPVVIENAKEAENGETVELPLAERLPERGYPVDLRLRVLPLDETDEEPVNAFALYISAIEAAEDADVVEVNPAAFVDADGMIYAELTPRADGLYAVGVPAGEEIEYAEADGDGEFEDLGDSAGATLSGPSLSGIGTSFTLDENGNPVVDD